jgi:homoserine dehydrogenase
VDDALLEGRRGTPPERVVVITTVVDPEGTAEGTAVDVPCLPATCRIGLLGLGNIGSAFARLTREAAARLSPRGVAPFVSAALVRSTAASRPASALVSHLTDSADAFFSEPIDIVVEVLGGIEPAYSLVRRALDRGIPVVTANKSLIAAHGDELARLARRRATALRIEAGCISGVPFLGTFERRPLAARASGVTGILNGTSNSILTAMGAGIGFDAALAEAQRLGFAEPDPSMDISGADAAEKLAILARLFGRVILDPLAVPAEAIGGIDPEDIAAGIAFDGAIRPVAHACWDDNASVRAFVGPAFLTASHPLARVAGVTNGLVIDAAGGSQCYIGPGAGPAVTAATLLDDVVELVLERRVRTPAPEPARVAASIARPESAWFLRLNGDARHSDVADLLGSYGIWCTRLARRGGRTYVLTCTSTAPRVQSALDAVQSVTHAHAAAFPALGGDAAC